MDPNNIQSATKMKIFFRLLPVVGIVLILFGFGRAVDRAFFDVPAYAGIGLGVLLFLTLFLKAEVANIKYYLNIFIYTLAVLAICVVGYLFALNYTRQIDLSKAKLYSLSEQSTKVVGRLKADQVEVVFFSPDRRPFQQIVDKYNQAGKKIKWTFIDAKKDPQVTRQYGERIANGTILIQSGKKNKRLSLGELEENYENTLTNAIVEVTRDKDIKIYFTTGHGEVAYENNAASRQRPAQQETPSLQAFKNYLSQRALQTDQINLAQGGFVPEDATLVIMAGPTSDLLPSEIAALEKYLGGDGKLLVLLDVPKNNFTAPLTNLKGLLKTYGVDAPDKLILDLQGNRLLGSASKPLITEYDPEHPITRDFNRRVNLPLNETRPVLPASENPGGYQVTELLKSSPDSWSEDMAKILASGGRITPPAQKQSQPLGVAVSPAAPPQQPGMPPAPAPKGGVRLLVYGTSDLIQDAYLASYPAAVQLMLNSINWLTQQEDLIAVPPKQIQGTPIHLTAGQLRLIFFLAIVLIPASLFFGGVSYSLLRRRR